MRSFPRVLKVVWRQAFRPNLRKIKRGLLQKIPVSVLNGDSLKEVALSDRADLLVIQDRGYCETIPTALNPEIIQRHALGDRSVWRLRDATFDFTSGQYFLDGHPIVESTSSGRLMRKTCKPWPFVSKLRESRPLFGVAQRKWNFYHWLLEDLPAILRAEMADPDVLILVPKSAPSFVKDSLMYLGLQFGFGDGLALLPDVVFPGRTADAGWHHFADLNLIKSRIPDPTEAEIATRASKIYVSRANSTRPVENERSLEDFLEGEGFQIIRAEDFSFRDQIHAFAGAKIVVGPHGAGLSNILFLGANSKVVELASEANVNQCFERLAKSLGHSYSRFILPVGAVADTMVVDQISRVSIMEAVADFEAHL